MTAVWREVTSWSCSACGAESLIVESEDWLIAKATPFERPCASCGKLAPGTTIRPAGVAYRITTRRDFYPRKSYSGGKQLSP